MYYTQSGQQIEDPEMGAMRRDIEESLENGDLDTDAALVSRKLSIRTTAQIDLDSGELEWCNENGIQIVDAEEVLELFELIGSVRAILYARLHDR